MGCGVPASESTQGRPTLISWSSAEKPEPTGLLHPPGRYVGPLIQIALRPCGVVIAMARVARVRLLVLSRQKRRHEAERVSADVHIRDRLFDLRHVASYAFCAGAVCGMARVRRHIQFRPVR